MRGFKPEEIATAITMYKEYLFEPAKIEKYKKVLAGMPSETKLNAQGVEMTPYEFGREMLSCAYMNEFAITMPEAEKLVETVRTKWVAAYYE